MKTLLEKVDYSNVENKYKMNDLFIMAMNSTKEDNKDLYEHIKCELYEIVYGKKISEEMADKWVKSMKSQGEHWTIDETTNAMQSMGYNCDRVDFYVVANLMYNDYYNLVKDDETMALKMAYDFLNDEDAKEHKLYDYWKYIVKRD